jgi:peptidoglycan hydrolase-like protein with peptidoglycan-binding domain
MTILRTATTVIASAALAAAGFTAAAPAALADGPDTSPQVIADIQALDWPEYKEGDTAVDVAVAEYLLRHLGHDKGKPDEKFDAATTTAVKKFQKAERLPESGRLNQETWNELSEAVFGEYGQGTTGDVVRAIQYSLVHDHGKKIEVDGKYGPATAKAVRELQKSYKIGVDGIVGPITFRAMVAGGD